MDEFLQDLIKARILSSELQQLLESVASAGRDIPSHLWPKDCDDSEVLQDLAADVEAANDYLEKLVPMDRFPSEIIITWRKDK